MWEFLGQLEFNQGTYDFYSGLSLSSFQPHGIESGDAKTQITVMSHKISITHMHKYLDLFDVVYLGEIFQPTAR